MEVNEVIVIGVAGGSASGKTTVVARIKSEFNDLVELISHDDYYLSRDDLSFEERTKLNFDHPSAFDTERLIQDIKELKQGLVVERPIYSYKEYRRLSETVQVLPKKVVIIDGIMIFDNRELLDLMDIKIFVDTDSDVRLIRRILRDVKERGRNLESVIEQYSKTVKPMHEQFVEPSKRYADIIIPNGGENEVAISMITNRIKMIIHDQEQK